MYAFVIEKKQSASDSSVGWKFVYGDSEESKVRSRFERSLKTLQEGWRIRLRSGFQILEDKTISDSRAMIVPSTQVSSSISNSDSLTIDADDIDIYDNWIFPDEDFPSIPDRQC